jgi:hypothetical protein
MSGRLPMRVPVGTECSPQSVGCSLPAMNPKAKI